MQNTSITLVYFSPTGTTRKVLKGIAQGIVCDHVVEVDITSQESREKQLTTSANDVLIVGVPVYKGRVPALVSDWLKTIVADNTPVVSVVVYGNRNYDNALLELQDILTERGGVPVAAAAYIGEHSFSSEEKPTAQGRPDEQDIAHARGFGESIQSKLEELAKGGNVAAINIPGERPYGSKTELWKVDFIAVDETCIDCGACAEACPVGAIPEDDFTSTNAEICLTCCACIKVCPVGARSIKEGIISQSATKLATFCKERKSPEVFL